MIRKNIHTLLLVCLFNLYPVCLLPAVETLSRLEDRYLELQGESGRTEGDIPFVVNFATPGDYVIWLRQHKVDKVRLLQSQNDEIQDLGQGGAHDTPCPKKSSLAVSCLDYQGRKRR